MKSAALIVIGDEILTGKIQDENSFVFARVMFERGVRVKNIVVIPDKVEIIAETVVQYAGKFDYVCTSGGVGPTHDDMTYDGIAHGFSLPLVEHEEALRFFQSEQARAGRGDVVSEVQKKMLRFPTPCTIHFIEPLWLPLVVVKNVYIFPGVPYLFKRLVSGLSHLFEGGKFFREVLYTDKSESNIATDLKTIQDQYPDVAIGSYPQMPGKPFNVMVTIEGVNEPHVARVAADLLPLIDGRKTTT